MEGERVLSICSGGENSLSLLSAEPELLVVVDRNPAQLALFELKTAAMEALEREESLGFPGYPESGDRWSTCGLLRANLRSGARDVWDGQRGSRERGMIHIGRVARTLLLLARVLLPMVHGRGCSRRLMVPETAEEQARFFRMVWDHRRCRARLRVLFGKPAIFPIAPGPDCFDFHDGDGVADLLLEKSRRHPSSVAAQQNHILHDLLFGHVGPHLPHFVREENYEVIRGCLEVVATHGGPVETAFPAFGRFDAFNLSNIVTRQYPDRATGWASFGVAGSPKVQVTRAGATTCPPCSSG